MLQIFTELSKVQLNLAMLLHCGMSRRKVDILIKWNLTIRD